MSGILLIGDLAIVLVIAGAAAWLCRSLGLSAVVGYLVAGAIIGKFQGDIAHATVLAIFLPVLAGLCRTIGSQSLACTLRGLSPDHTLVLLNGWRAIARARQ